MSQKSSCPYWGDSPVNHGLAYIGQTLGVFLDPLLSFIAGRHNGLFSRFLKHFNYFYIFLSTKMGVITFGKNIDNATTGRSKLIWQEAKQRGIEMQQLIIYGKPLEQYRAKVKLKNSKLKWFYFESLPIPPHLPQDDYNFIDDKVYLKKVLSRAGIPVPKSISVSNKKQAILAYHTLQKPIIVKPRVGSRARHTTLFINNLDELLNAVDIAQKLCKYVAIEEYLTGPVSRATLVGGKLVGFFSGFSPKITGDGISTIAELILKKNKNKPDKVDDVIITKEHNEYLARSGYTVNSVLEKDKTISVVSRTGRFFGGETYEHLGDIHPKLKEILEKTKNAVNVPVVGYDLIIENPEINPDNQKWGIIEANSLPFIDLHYFALYGEPVNIAKYIWDLWE